MIVINSDLTRNDLFMQIIRVEEKANLPQKIKKKTHRKEQMKAYFLKGFDFALISFFSSLRMIFKREGQTKTQ